MISGFQASFEKYPQQCAPLLHEQYKAWSASQPLNRTKCFKKSWLIFGFGKVGRGCAYYYYSHQAPVIIVDPDEKSRALAESFDIATVDPADLAGMKNAVEMSDIIVTATGKENIVSVYPKEWFREKILVNMGVPDEFGPAFSKEDVLNNKLPVNFVLDDPTPIHCIDPALYAHNMAGLELLNKQYANGVHSLPEEIDNYIISSWCRHHQVDFDRAKAWLIF